MAYRPGQGINSGSADRLRDRKVASEICSICGKTTDDAGLNCASVDDSKQWTGILGGQSGSKKKARCSECTKPLPDDHDPARGPFCPACEPAGGWQPPAAPAAASADEDSLGAPREEIKFGHLIRPGICKTCSDEKRSAERGEAKAKKEVREQAKAQALDEGVMEAPERIPVVLGERPFGMTPSKVDGAGYLVTKTSDGKPAAKAGIRPGWKVAEVSGTSCEGLDLEAVQALLKAANLPVDVVFEKVPNGGDFCTTCTQILVWAAFSRKMRTKPPDKRRCIACMEAAGAKE